MSEKDGAGKKSPKPNGDANGTLGANSEIGRKLKQYYDELVSEAVPDRFDELLKQLEQAKSANDKGA
jgi:hypothetical protein